MTQPRAQAEERTLPHNLDAERSLLGAILVRNDALDLIGQTIAPDDFFRAGHRLIYAAMLALHARQVAIDFVTLKDELARAGHGEDVGGPAYLASLADGMPRSTNIQHYAEIVREKADLRRIVYAGNTIVAAAYAGEEPASAIIAHADETFLALRRNGHQSCPPPLSARATRRFAVLEERVQHKGLRGLDTGFPSVNDLTLGLRAGDLDIIAARPSIGKSAFTTNIALHAARQGHRVVIFSLEMTTEQLEDRILSQLSHIPCTRIQSGHISETEWPALAKALDTMHGVPMHIHDRAGLRATHVRATCRQIIAAHGPLALVVVDYIQLMAGATDRHSTTRTEELSDAASRLKDLAKELGVPVLVVSQLRRHDGRPGLDDLRDCGTLEQAADLVAFLYRQDHRLSGLTEFIIAKQRNGDTGTVLLMLDRDTTAFAEAPEGAAEVDKKPRARQVKAFARRWRQVAAENQSEEEI